ncbi:DUF4166 domain-containing protein [Methylobacterium sp. JK268]
MTAPRLLVVGGAGAFGRRLAAGLAATTAATVVIAGRDLARAQAAAAAIARDHPGSRVEALRLDARAVTAETLRGLALAGVIDAAGPFQDDGTYALARAAIGAGLPYADLADARSFVAGFSRLDAEARAAGVAALTGASSTPALSHAVLDVLTAGWARVDAVEVLLSPGNRAPRGRAVMESILSYAGRPVRVWREGGWQERPGWGLTARVAIPGLGRRLASLCETPDLDLLPARFPEAREAVFRAGLELPVLHLGLTLASLPVRAGLLASLRPFAGLFLWAARLAQGLGSDRGAMLVRVEGRDGEGRPARATWTLIAEGGDGPVVPTLPALAVARRWLDGPPLAPGARACLGAVDLAAIEAEMARYRIRTTLGREAAPPLFARALGAAFAALPAAVREVHAGAAVLAGRARVTRGGHPLARLAAALAGFPPAGEDVPVRVTIAPTRDGEIWTRFFAGKTFHSRLSDADPGAVEERFGPLTFRLRLAADGAGLRLVVEGWRLGPLPLPRALAPRSEAGESVDPEGRFRFDVPVRLPLAGLVVHYRGWLVPEGDAVRAPVKDPVP